MNLTNILLNKNKPKVIVHILTVSSFNSFYKLEYDLTNKVFIVEIRTNKEHRVYFKKVV